MKPYYQDSNKCACGCGNCVERERRFVSGHNLKCLIRTESHCDNISRSQRKSWITKRKRIPIGSTNMDVHGYIRVKVLSGSGMWDKEHAIVARKMLGRNLNRDEHVHHINGIKSDNRPENLYICSRSKHSQIEAQATKLLKSLVVLGIVKFNKEEGFYERVA